MVAGVHILGLAVSVGILLWFDLRLLGLSMTTIRVSDVYRRLMPWAGAGFAVMFVSGAAIFAAFATAAYGNVYFRLKMLAIVLAGVNAAVYHMRTVRQIQVWDASAVLPAPARRAGLISILLWLSVIVAGRMMLYSMF